MVLIPRIIAGLMSMDGLAAWATKPTRDNENMTKEYVWLMKKFETLPRTFLNVKLHLPYDHWLECTTMCRTQDARVLYKLVCTEFSLTIYINIPLHLLL